MPVKHENPATRGGPKWFGVSDAIKWRVGYAPFREVALHGPIFVGVLLSKQTVLLSKHRQ